MKVLVTGGAGYIGSHVVKLLGKRGYEVVTVDNLSTGNRWAVLYGKLFVGDIGDKRFIRYILEREKPKAVIHFAASISVPESVEKPLLYYWNNTAKTTAFLDVLKEFGIDFFIFSSTAAVYGIPKEIPIKEDHPISPINPYGSSKAMGEKIVVDAAKRYGFKWIILRYFNVAGADPELRIGQAYPKPTHLITRCVRAALGKEPYLEIYGDDYPTRDGTCIRDYIHVSDLAEAHVLSLGYLKNGGESGIFNCGYGRGFSVKEVVDVTKKVTGVDFPVKIGPRRPGDPPELVADPSRIMELMGWKPRYQDLGFIVETAFRWEKKLTSLYNCEKKYKASEGDGL